MTKAKFKITLEEPCPVPKDQLSKVDMGYYCSVCSKCVVDYRQYSDQQMVREFKKDSSKERCGIFTPHQLEKVYKEKSAKKTGIFSSLLLSGLLLINKNSKAQSEITADTVMTVQTDTSSVEQDAIQLVKVDSIGRDSVIQEGVFVSALNDTIVPPFINICDKGIEQIIDFSDTELSTYGIFYMEPEEVPEPFPFEKIIDSTKTKLNAWAGFFGFMSSKTSMPNVPKNPLRNSDRPLWIESLRHRFRGKKRK